MKNILEYKGYHAKIEFDAEEMLLHGKIEGINDLVNFESKNADEIEKEFHDAVDDYLEFCMEVGKEPDKEYKGSFNVRIGPDLHKRLAVIAMKNGDTLNAAVEKAVSEYVFEESREEKRLENTIKILVKALKTESTYNYDYKRRHKAEILPFDGVKMRYSKEKVD